jgi:hypothetical protein
MGRLAHPKVKELLIAADNEQAVPFGPGASSLDGYVVDHLLYAVNITFVIIHTSEPVRGLNHSEVRRFLSSGLRPGFLSLPSHAQNRSY